MLATFLICGFGFTQQTYAQDNIEVSGQVVDAEDEQPLPGVNVTVKGTPTRGTSTDDNGEYQLRVPSAQDTLLFSFVGYVTQEVPVNGRTTINVQMASDVQALEDVVVVGYGTQEEREITSSVTNVSSEEFNQGNVSDPTRLLQGKVPGLSIYKKGGDPNADPTIRLRGISTVGANTEPLVVVDGVSGASLDNIDPNDIESIDVLKDGSAAAIYGTRGSSGVILVTTKKGSKQAGPDGGSNVQLDYRGYVSSASVVKKQPVMDAEQYVNAGGNDPGSANDWQDPAPYTHLTSLTIPL
jgi:iron complex outermembrane receptor protein